MFLCTKKLTLKDSKYFIISYLIFVVLSIIIIILFSKPEIAIAINKQNCKIADIFFKYITHLGHGLWLLPLAFYFFLKNKDALYITIFSSVFLLIFVNLLKRTIYSQRPKLYFKDTFITYYDFHFVQGVDLHSIHSFPSGHTATAFTIFFLATLFISNRKIFIQILFFILAFLVAYSRLYLSQHFLIDVLAGSFIGIFSVIAGIFVFKKIKSFKKNKNEN